MPELPEVETVVCDLKPYLEGRRITSVWVSKKRLRRPWLANWTKVLLGRRIDKVLRRGKWICLWMNSPWQGDRHVLAIHLGMSGQLTIMPANEPRALHTHLSIGLSRGKQELRLRDTRRFGSAMVFTFPEWVEWLGRSLGPEALATTPEYWLNRLHRTRRCLKAVLLDQRVVAGVGNIYADESLFEARLHPARLGQDIQCDEARQLQKAIDKVLNRAIKRRGSSIRNYVGGSGLKGEYQNEFRVYGRTGQPCPRCKTPIECIRLAGRSTHFCPKCQRV